MENKKRDMKCPNCKTELVSGVKFCSECGHEVKNPCPNPDCTCKNIPEEAQFCPECGTKIIVVLAEPERQKELPQKRQKNKYWSLGLIVIVFVTIILISYCSKKREYEQQRETELQQQRETELQQQREMDRIKPLITVTYPIEMVTIEGGTFQMGSNNGDNEKPIHTVTVNSFQMGRTEVTQAQWESVMGENPSSFKGADNPVENVSWDDVQKFIETLNRVTGKKYRLPTEAEWEYAAGGGSYNRTMYDGADDENLLGDYAWYDENSGKTTHPVATKLSNRLGLYDMIGNVLEWCQDWYGEYSVLAQTNPAGSSSGSDRVWRGGCWSNNSWGCRVAYRYGFVPSARLDDLGFRLVLVP